MKSLFKIVSLVLVAMVTIVACETAQPTATPIVTQPTATLASTGTGSTTGQAGSRSDIHIAVVTHGQASDPFWSVVKNGVDQAAKDMGVTVQYQASLGAHGAHKF